jgi:hypothetical protein
LPFLRFTPERAEKIPVSVNVDDAAVLKESEVAVPGAVEGVSTLPVFRR